ncbi:hypothetical protein AMK59_4870, partial [Oryctes borbonicus]
SHSFYSVYFISFLCWLFLVHNVFNVITMVPPYTYDELVDMLLIYGEAQQRAVGASLLYREKYPYRQHPDSRTFTSTVHRLRETHGLKQHRGRGGGPKRSDHILYAEDEILEMIEDDPTLSTRVLARRLRVSRNTVWRTLRKRESKPSDIRGTRIETLSREDYAPRVQFCEWFVEQCESRVDFASNILIADELTFTRTGVEDYQDAQVWSVDKDDSMEQCESRVDFASNILIADELTFTRTGIEDYQDAQVWSVDKDDSQKGFSVNVWAGVLNGNLIGPFILPAQLTTKKYFRFLRNVLPELLEDVPLNIRRDMWLLHHGTTQHFEGKVRQHLEDIFENRWIGRDVPWPPRSSDLNPIHFYLLNRMRSLIYDKIRIKNVQELEQRIDIAVEIIREQDSNCCERWLRRTRHCIQVNGRHFEHLL